MPQKTTRLPVHVAPSSNPGTESEKKASELTVNKIVAGAGAAATAAAVGSYFGAAGTVTGAAIGSVVTTIGAVVYQHSLDRTRDTVRARIRLPGGRTVDVPGTTQVPAPQVPGPRVPPGYAASGPNRPNGYGPGPTGPPRPYVPGPTVPYGAAPARVYTAPVAARPGSRRRVLLASAVAALAFVLGLLTITGIEFVKGSTLATGQEGTSVGRVLEREPATDRGTEAANENTGSEPADPTAEPSPTASPEATSTTPEPTVTATPTPTETAEPGNSGDTAQPRGESTESDTGSDTGSDSAESESGN
jgi:hypothetical protein